MGNNAARNEPKRNSEVITGKTASDSEALESNTISLHHPKVEQFAALLKNENVSVAKVAERDSLIATFSRADKDAIPALEKTLRDMSLAGRYYVIEALAKIGTKGAFMALVQYIKDEGEYSTGAIHELGKTNRKDVREAAIPVLVDVLERYSSGVPSQTPGAAAWYLLDEIGDTAARVKLVKADFGDPEFKKSDFAAVPEIMEFLKSEDEGLRGRAACALGRIGSGDAVPGLVEALNDRDEYVRSMAAEALGLIGSRDAVPGLLQAHQKGKVPADEIAAALGQIGQTAHEALPFLVEMLSKEIDSEVATAILKVSFGPEVADNLLTAFTPRPSHPRR